MHYSFKFLSLFVFVLIINIASSSPNHERDLGDLCFLQNSEEGICKKIKDCDFVKNLFKHKRNSEILSYRCKFHERTPYVCCPTIELGIDDQSVTNEVEASTVKTFGMSKYKKALCENKTPEVVLNLNIIGGVEADVAEFPYIAAIGYKTIAKRGTVDEDKIEYKCGGSIIADDIVITAAHCVNKVGIIPTVVKLGRTSLVPHENDYSDGDDVEIEYSKIHPNYSQQTKHNDIALMKLKRPFNSSSVFIKPICLSTNDENLPKNFTIAGFGINDMNTQKTSNWLLKATVEEYNHTKCQKVYSGIFQERKEIIDSHFCAAGYKGADSCQGDSGGPLSFNVLFENSKLTYLHGIVSAGIGCGSKIPAIYTKVNKYLDWIEKEMNLME